MVRRAATLEAVASVSRRPPLWVPLGGRLSASAGRRFDDASRAARLDRIRRYVKIYESPWRQGAERQVQAAQFFRAAVADVLWAGEQPDPYSFDVSDRHAIAYLCPELAGCFYGFAVGFDQVLCERLVRAGFRLVATLPDRYQSDKDQLTSRLYHNYPVPGTERWWERPHNRDPKTVAAQLECFATSEAFAARAGGEVGRRDSLVQSLCMANVMLPYLRERDANKLYDSIRERVNPTDHIQVELFLGRVGIKDHRFGRRRAAGEAFKERLHVLRTRFPERLEHMEAGSVFFLDKLGPGWVSDADRWQAICQHVRLGGGIQNDIASDNAADFSEALVRRGVTEKEVRSVLDAETPQGHPNESLLKLHMRSAERRCDKSDVKTGHTYTIPVSLLTMPRFGNDATSAQASEVDLKEHCLPCRQPASVDDSLITSLRNNMRAAIENAKKTNSHLSYSEIANELVRIGWPVSKGSVHALVNTSTNPSIRHLDALARSLGLSLVELVSGDIINARVGAGDGIKPYNVNRISLELKKMHDQVTSARPGLTNAAIAESCTRLGRPMTAETVRVMLSGTDNPTVKYLDGLAKFFGVSFSELITSAAGRCGRTTAAT